MVKRSLIVSLFIALVLISTSVAPILAGEEDDQAFSRLLTTPDSNWQDPIKITSNDKMDTYPNIQTDGEGISHIIYHQDSDEIIYQKYARPGKLIVTEKQAAQGSVIFHRKGIGNDPQPTKIFGMDAKGVLHMIWMEKVTKAILYQRLDTEGDRIGEIITLITSSQNPVSPTLAVQDNGNALIAWIEESDNRQAKLTIIQPNLTITHLPVMSDVIDVSLIVDSKNGGAIHYLARGLSSPNPIYHLRYSSNLHLEIDAHKIYEDQFSGLDKPMPNGCITPDGIVHLLNGDSMEFERALYYGKLDPDGNDLTGGLAFMITDKASDYGDILKNDFYYLIINYGNSEDDHIYSIMVYEGEEVATAIENKIKASTGLSGRSYRPMMSMDDDGGTHLIFVNNGDGDDEIFYSYSYHLGVALFLGPEEQANLMFVHPVEIRSENFSVINTGGQKDTIFLNLNLNYNGHQGKGWDAWLDVDEVELGSGHAVGVKVFVRGPDQGKSNDYIEVCINGTSERDPDKTDDVCFRTFLIVDHEVGLECDPGFSITLPGAPADFSCKVVNEGDVLDDINVTVKNITSGWSFSLNKENFTNVQPKENRPFSLSITPPGSALSDDIGTVKLKANLFSSPSITKEIILHIYVSPNVLIEMEVDYEYKYEEPGNSTEFKITIHNHGNMAGTLPIKTTPSKTRHEWNYTLDRTSVAIPNNGQVEVTLTVKVPVDAFAWERLRVVIEIDCPSCLILNSVEALTIADFTNIHYGLEIEPFDNEIQVIEPGGFGYYEYVIWNDYSGGPMRVKMDITSMRIGWWVEFIDNGVPVEEILMEPGEKRWVTLKVYVYEHELTGTYPVVGEVFESYDVFSGPHVQFSLNARVNETYGIEMATPISNLTGRPGSTVDVSITIENKGNHADNISLSIDGIPSDWSYNLSSIKSTLAPLGAMEKVNAKIPIEIPSRGNLSTGYKLKLTGMTSNNISTEIVIDLNLSFPNLKILEINYKPKKAEEDRKQTISVVVTNDGAVDTDGVIVRIFKNAMYLGDIEIGNLSVGENKTGDFVWKSKAGPQILNFEIDPENNISEESEDDNNFSDIIKVKSNEAFIPGFGWFILIITLVIFAIVIRRR